MMKVIIGIDPHKSTHTAVAIDNNETELCSLQVRANASQTCRLLEWAANFETRTWAIEGATGLGYLLGQQLLDAGETVVDVPATLAARVRVLGTGKSNKTDPNDARSIAIAALRSSSLAPVRPADHATVLKMLARRNKQLAASRTRTVCRLHAVIRELVEGGTGLKLKAGKAKLLLEQFEPTSPDQVVRHQVACEHLDDLARVDTQIAGLHARIRDAVAAANTSVTEIHGVGAIIAAMAIGYTGDVSRFRDRDHYAAYTGTAPIELSSGERKIHRLSRRGNRQLNHSPRSGSPTRPGGSSTTARSPRAAHPRTRSEP